MKKSILEIYALAVCFFAAATLLIVGGAAAWDVVQLSAPELTLNSHDWRRYQDDEAYAESLKQRCSSKDEVREIPTGAELTKKRETGYAQELVEHRRNALLSLMQNLLIILVASIAFFVHWRIAGRARATTG
jgi:hypothetical protein